ncbi:hypothetical protein C4544_03575 [candidate division WS5 bacterium]|uniref:DUF5615 domain-containing protein n=1 Tax=candidate division WS5 bacterium TaxID=2093353 RepID=A0A419DDJ5_9BACT|nr:MAG: hypothetical protein C4544_03575 [candidate division WS5 bacterium]
MKFLADVNLPQSVIVALNTDGHDILDVKKINLKAKDIELIETAKREHRIILTLDKDFISLTQFPQYQAATIVIRLKDQKPEHILEHLKQLLEYQKEGILNTSLTIIREEKADSCPY